MIGRLQGQLLEKHPPHLLIDIQGVGYDVLAPMSTFYRLPELGATVVLHTHFSVSETAQQLYGFIEQNDRLLFRQLIKINGVGPKMALAILSGMETQDFVRCVAADNVSALVKVPGVGKKTAERLIVEMRDRLKDWSIADVNGGESSVTDIAQGFAANDIIADAESALVALGYKPVEAAKVVAAVQREQEVERSEDLIRLALRSMLPA